MNDQTQQPQPNLAETLARVLPTAAVVFPREPVVGDVVQIAVPKAFDLKAIDTENMLPNPKRTVAAATFSDAPSFLKYIDRHASPDSTVVWCTFNPQTFDLSFKAVIDDHAHEAAGWRAHTAQFTPALSSEWKAWKGAHKTVMAQVAFAEWLQEHETDIASGEGLPTSLQLMAMATEFVANEEHALKSAVRLQSGGVRLTYIADPDKGTTEEMKLFEKFALGIPVFHGDTTAWRLVARLKYRNNAGKVNFFYELVRADRVHDSAARALIEKVGAGLNGLPLLMGAC